jgi:cation diffusion facilitator CzcD-associated flavoprotein CzcO
VDNLDGDVDANVSPKRLNTSPKEHFAAQPETERYLNYVADKFDLRRDIQFKSRVTAAHYEEDTRSWDVILEDGRRYTTCLLITAIGVLSAATMPRISGVETFQGQSSF